MEVYCHSLIPDYINFPFANLESPGDGLLGMPVGTILNTLIDVGGLTLWAEDPRLHKMEKVD